MIHVYGASDDLIEVEGDIVEEFSYSDDEDRGDVLAFSDGTLLSVEYTRDGIWRISPLSRGSAEMTITQAVSADDDEYSDKATLDGDIRWVAHGVGWATRTAAPA